MSWRVRFRRRRNFFTKQWLQMRYMLLLAGRAVSRVFSVIGEKEDDISRLAEDLEKAQQRLGELILAQDPGWQDQARAVKGILDQFALLEQTAQEES